MYTCFREMRSTLYTLGNVKDWLFLNEIFKKPLEPFCVKNAFGQKVNKMCKTLLVIYIKQVDMFVTNSEEI